MLLPLVVGGRPIFGAIQLESANGFDEADLVFVNAVVNQLAVALDRHLALERRQTSAKAPIQEAPDGPASEPLRPDERDLGERYAALVDNIDHAFVWEAEGDTFQITYVSARAELLLGYPRQRWLEDGDFWAGCVHPTDRESLAQAFRSALSGKRDQQIDHRCVDAEGRLVWLHTGIHAVRDGTRRLQGISIDVTRAKDAEERLREQLDLTRAVAHSIGDGVLAVDLQGRLTLCNPAAAGMLGWTEGEMLGRPVKDVLQIHAADGSALADDEWPFDTAMLRGKASSRDDCAFVDGHDTSFGVSLTSGPLWREGLVSGAVLAFRSTSEHDRSHSALRAAVERAQRDTHDREDLLALVSHDLKNPLSIILMTASSLARTFEAADQGRQRGQLDSIKRSAERMNRLVKDLLDTASLEAGSLSVEPCSCAVAPLLEEALRSMRPLAAHKSIRLEQDIASDLPPVRADSGRIEQVFSNLLGNAIKFTPKDGVITLRVRVRDGVVLFAVSDTGPGMSESELPHLFDRYWQARRTAKLGTGLGLSIVKGIVVAHGGQVWVESQVGAGSTFFFTLPIA